MVVMVMMIIITRMIVAKMMMTNRLNTKMSKVTLAPPSTSLALVTSCSSSLGSRPPQQWLLGNGSQGTGEGISTILT